MREQTRALVMAAGMTGTGVFHLVRPQVYDWMIPPELGPARPWVIGSGVVELATAALLALPATRRAGGWAAVGLLVGVLPAHAQTLRATRRHPAKLAVAAARIPFQVPMVQAALRVARGR
ncbi:DoxX family protein [Modestobacter roseus]|uniref:Putative membrane protein n=1 Tax=Modestobacter roseus TaxID=1181884 RepID=A0A562INT3_9ACTN|nr:DoxX family protein [Modestobacter roseus]TWH72244.1 putative membrane protein [Modestobacter roseus]